MHHSEAFSSRKFSILFSKASDDSEFSLINMDITVALELLKCTRTRCTVFDQINTKVHKNRVYR